MKARIHAAPARRGTRATAAPDPTLEARRRELTYCAYCPKMCRPACPVSNVEGREAVIPQAKMATLDELRRGLRPWAPGFAEVLYACTGCGRCQVWCVHGNDVATTLAAGRAVAREHGAAHPRLASFADRWRAHDRRARARLREHHGARFAARAEVALLPGCDALPLVDAILAACERAGLPIALADLPHASAGHALAAAGEHAAFREVARSLSEAAAGYATLVTACPGCAHALREAYPAEGVAPAARMLHTTELLAPAAGRIAPARRLARAAYHDACHLGRRLGVYDQPRALLARCVEDVVEFPRAREDGICSGGGGLVPLTAPRSARAMAADRLAEARRLGAQVVVTACPTSRRRMRSAAAGVAVLDILELIATAGG